MDEALIKGLLSEYKTLRTKMETLANLIEEYGYELPFTAVFENYNQEKFELEDMFGDYPENGIWKDKILFALKEAKVPSAVPELSKIIQNHEPDTDIKRINNALTQYCSAMGVTGEIMVEKGGYRNKYGIKEKPSAGTDG